MEQKVYDNLLNGALNGYWECNLDDRDRNPYKRIVTGAVRAVDYIASLDEWDGKTIGVTGSSHSTSASPFWRQFMMPCAIMRLNFME